MLRVDDVRMFGDRVLVDPDEKHATSEGGLHIPQVVLADNPNYFTMTGIVLRLGDGAMHHTFQCRNCNALAPQDEGPCPGCHQPLGNHNARIFETGERTPFDVQVGDRVLFNRFAGKQVEIEIPQERHGLGPAFDDKGDALRPFTLGEVDGIRHLLHRACPKTTRMLIMHEPEILGVVEGDHRIVPGYMAPKWGKVTEGLTTL